MISSFPGQQVITRFIARTLVAAQRFVCDAPLRYCSEFNDLLLEIDSDARKLLQDVLPEEPVNLGAHPLTGVRGVHHQDAPIHPMATIKPEVHFVRDVIAFGTRTRFGCLQRPELNRGKASSLRADERLRDSANFPHR